MTDLINGPEPYRPTNYWSHYEKSFLPELRRKGLRDFRSRRHSTLDSFGAVDLPIEANVRLRHGFRGAGAVNRMIRRILDVASPLVKLEIDYMAPRPVAEYFYGYVESKFERLGLDLARCPTTNFGRPLDAQDIGGGTWSLTHLQYCSMFADAARHVRLGNEPVVCELGSGMGRNIEVIANLYPAATLIAIDIPPQLYVAHQYLSKAFPNRVVRYDEAIRLDPTDASARTAVQGKIVILPSWRMPAWSSAKIDVFWNSASFQEMEPEIVANYLKLVVQMSPEWIYINASPKGNYWGEWKPGRGGTKQPVVEHYYADALRATYDEPVTYPTDYFLGRIEGYRSYVFKRRTSPIAEEP